MSVKKRLPFLGTRVRLYKMSPSLLICISGSPLTIFTFHSMRLPWEPRHFKPSPSSMPVTNFIRSGTFQSIGFLFQMGRKMFPLNDNSVHQRCIDSRLSKISFAPCLALRAAVNWENAPDKSEGSFCVIVEERDEKVQPVASMLVTI